MVMENHMSLGIFKLRRQIKNFKLLEITTSFIFFRIEGWGVNTVFNDNRDVQDSVWKIKQTQRALAQMAPPHQQK